MVKPDSAIHSYPHVPIGVRLREIQQANQGPKKHVLILGAGMAGLGAACELRGCGHDVTIVEASDRLGGRVFTHYFDDGQHGELGAMRIAAAHDYTHHYARELDLELQAVYQLHRRELLRHPGSRCARA